ncbi:unnamed protein product [Spirodela intermedia]|uniref:aldehyde oxygenase (deformylating) n=1 Tax=Spirodela intermedia TaxID=51605 RepID=A0A7I8JB30_SPIIN|nr:unnamed protein product [Spirodela intermedia]CAA2628055.1 unnamed protein product [Spirodela intermedia]CAA6667309.1 unnamed protein product [Spirodela intermedia]CAA6667310.1 unnamed protein product [Spirodela intermedia]
MALGMSEELLPVFVPIVVYWVASGIYHVLLSPKDEHRLFPKGEEEAQNLATRRQVIVGVLANQAMQMLLATVIFMVTGGEKGATVDAPSASLLQVAGQLAVAMLFMDGWEYFWHRWTHENKFLYKHVHAMHHLLIVPYAYGAQYIHPVDAFFGEIIGGFLSVFISGMSLRTTAVFFSLLTVKAVDDHCGQWFPHYNPIHRFMTNNTAFHTVHHQHQGMKHNYSVHFLSTWDLILGTYLPHSVEERKGGGYQIRTAKDD